jgi:hypothetical protein
MNLKVRIGAALERALWSFNFKLAAKREIHGIRVGVALLEAEDEVVFAKLEAALDLLKRYDQRQLARLRRFARVLVFGSVGPQGEWFRHARTIRLGERQVVATDTHAAHVAATIVHETTHAWLESLGFQYRPDRRRRIEALCYRAEAAFARKIPGGEDLSAYYMERARAILAGEDADWSDNAFRDRRVVRLAALGVPQRLAEILAMPGRGPAV